MGGRTCDVRRPRLGVGPDCVHVLELVLARLERHRAPCLAPGPFLLRLAREHAVHVTLFQDESPALTCLCQAPR